MAQFFKAKPKASKGLAKAIELTIERLDHQGAGIAEHSGQVVFVPGALPGEKVKAQLSQQKKRFAHAKLIKVLSPSEHRIAPQCPHYAQCGGCDLQHLAIEQQRQAKAASLQSLIAKYSKQPLPTLQPAITADQWGYRRRTRLSLKPKPSGGFAFGFRAKASDKIIDIQECPILEPQLAKCLSELRQTLSAMRNIKAIGHIELIQAGEQSILLLRLLKSLNSKDMNSWQALAQSQGLRLLARDNQGQHQALDGGELNFAYAVQAAKEEPKLDIGFQPDAFIQVNDQINQQMVAQAVEWLAPSPNERILDLFCGVGNFSLPIAAQQPKAEVIAVEGVKEMVAQGRDNAKSAALDNLTFYHEDLSDFELRRPWLEPCDKLLLDPARAGAAEVLTQLAKLQPNTVVYVSCNPASLARDSQILLEQGYQLKKLKLVDMFPQTHHLESIALFRKVG
ncbi:23S rRNA (uracil(1939)-C(5))-methyltransferase RlmD [Paraferrimonas sedimenticola]|uniref:23S rRNA (uracil(1939)-C(5))-methyltransferase RlmD n=1 Tax=Paraferrimonas sedimenticola TaxID=375674 RepID=A0AA37RX01_9GAMM|nr:23S rRNA (uracil(1939)-C(5))-methyltransferase RlmD [Paraferrimonas sedimenticola]GLP96874.1 23S rRNA (uracil(1939)-C(5))-methyltransferase RlmD [Paraferrimonas sedimenticola]